MRLLHSSTRRILDVHYSDRNLVSFLIHIGNETELRSELSKFNITAHALNSVSDIDPHRILGDFNYSYRHLNLSAQTSLKWVSYLEESFYNVMQSGDNSNIPTFRRNDEIYSTIDYIFISNQMCPMLKSTDIHRLHSSWTDHQLLSLSINLGQNPTGFSLWRANPILAQQKEYLWYLHIQPPIATRLQCLPVMEQQIEFLQRELIDIAALKAGIRWKENGEKSAGYLKRIHQVRNVEQTINCLQNPTAGSTVSSHTAEPEHSDIYRVYLTSNRVEQWKVLKVFQHVIQKYYSDDYKEAINYFKNSFKKFLNDYSTPDKRLQMAIEKMTNSVDAVLESKPAQVVFEKRKTGERKQLYNAHAQNSVYQDKATLVDSNNIIKKSNFQGKDMLKKKKLKRLQVKDMKDLPLNQKVHALVGAFGSNNILNLASPGLVPERFQYEILKRMKRYKFTLPLAANEKERQFLIQLSNCKSLEDIEPLVKNIPLVPPSGSFTFFSIALTKLIALWQSEVLLNHKHKEAWYQMHVYGDLLDSAFLFDKNYNIKRSECHASTIKYLKKIKKIDNKEKDVKVDLILFNHGCGDMFTCEDKPESVSPGVVQDDFEKGNMLREKRLLYLQSIVPYKSNVKHIKVLSAQFHGLTLTIYGSKMTEVGDIIYMVNIKFTGFIN
ncbi:hypothetical protein G6F57_007808 [Rhizopus arrhizus]|nr:hypothetical protein G6F30_003577 [Rhizopus arrhizus]KAG0988271.1 hypothetical protein G6F29_001882 [Rhizopus arrhizus]KAG0991568.1 hypothetical protein G6F28_008469 [Rhizopus arrhizus]KAG1005561.1 hypothetical protein G6F27_009109 [Rhizopus arrhizus]KAG1027054.1 hypothetical protein G6F26_003775 [Rhizopus arrhizus]